MYVGVCMYIPEAQRCLFSATVVALLLCRKSSYNGSPFQLQLSQPIIYLYIPGGGGLAGVVPPQGLLGGRVLGGVDRSGCGRGHEISRQIITFQIYL